VFGEPYFAYTPNTQSLSLHIIDILGERSKFRHNAKNDSDFKSGLSVSDL